MNKSTLISVIVPVYNVEKYVAKCIDSILLQTFKNFELLLIDDGSLDNSGRICDEYLPKDKRIKVFHKDNGGLSDARNFGFSKSIGEYICFIDSDDYVTSDYLEHLYNLIIEHNADIACADYKTVEENQSTFEQDNLLKNYEINKIDNTIQYNTIQYNTIQYNTIHLLKTLLTEKKFQHTVVWNKLYKRELIKKIEFPKGKNFEDNLYNFKSFELCNKYVYSNKVIYNYLLRKDSITKQKLNIKDFDKIWISNTIKEECKKYNDVELDIYAQKRLVYCYVMIFLKWMNNNSNFSYAEIRPYIKNYKKEKKGYIRYFKNFFRIVSFLICIDIRFAKIFYKMYNILKK